MKFAIYIPNFGEDMGIQDFVRLAQEAEAAGWDGFFIWDHILADKRKKLRLVDPWITLAAIAAKTERIRIGTTITPIPRRRPWKLARETVSLDHLSNGRLILGVGIGFPPDAEYTQFGEDGDERTRAAKLDEGLAILTGLWTGQPFRYDGAHYHLARTTFLPPALQSPRIPIWVGGMWPNKAPFRRAAQWDGVIPLTTHGLVLPETLETIRAYIQQRRTTNQPYDVALIGHTPGDRPKKAAQHVAAYIEKGATWWLESLYAGPRRLLAGRLKRIQQGPPPT